MKLKCGIVLLCILHVGASYAQQHRKEFGHNRVQYKNFEWYFYSTDNYDIHYYFLGEEYAKIALDYLDEEYDKITDLLGYAPFFKTKIFLYNSAVDLMQSNIGVAGNTFTIAGQTNFVKLQVEVAYSGDIVEFKKELKYELTKLLLDDMMFGGNLAAMLQNTYLFSLPEWFNTGVALYNAHGWSVEMDDFMRDYLSNKKIRKLTRLEGKSAHLVGQSIWNYIALKYGKSNLSNILNLTRIIRNVEHSVASSLGIPFKQFIYEWATYYREANTKIERAYKTPDKSHRLIRSRGQITRLTQVRTSPDGTKIAYVKTYKGKYVITIKDLASGKEYTALKGGYHSINQKVDYTLPIMDWVSDHKLGAVQNWYGVNYLVTYDCINRTKQRKSLVRFNQVKNIGFNDNGKLAILSADIKGQNDLYLLSLRRNAIKRLTKDKYDDRFPQFIPGTNAIVFSSNRPNDSLKMEVKDIAGLEVHNLFALDLDTTTTVLHRITNTLSNETKPIGIDTQHLFFLSDQQGINNLYRYNFTNDVYNQVSNFSTSIKEYDISPVSHDLTYLMLNNGKTSIYLNKKYNIDQTSFTPPTLRNQLKQATFLSNRQKEKLAQEEKKVEELELELDDGLFDLVGEMEEDQVDTEEDLFIDTDDYQFEEGEDQEKFSFLTTYQKMQRTPSVMGPLPFETVFASDNVITSFLIDPIRGVRILMEYEMSDILENHKFYGGVMTTTDLKSGDFFAEYQFLKYTIDFKFRYDRNVYLHQSFPSTNAVPVNEVTQKYKKNTFNLGVSLPFSVSNRIDLSMLVTHTKFINLDYRVVGSAPGVLQDAYESSHSFLGFSSQWIYDNTLTNGLNIFEGTRGKVAFEHHQSVSTEDRSFSKLTVDLRRYQKIHKELVFATRLYFGKSFGKRPITYMLGGIDNWVFNKTEDSPKNDSPLYFSGTKDNTDVLFTEFVNLRGFDYNKFNGSNVLTFNAELRLPIAKYLTRGTIQSHFLRNLQFIGFYDIGSAWNGLSPFNKNHTVNDLVIKTDNSTFQATVRSSNNPWLASYGVGVRTVLFGYYMRFDFARPFQDYQWEDTKFYLSLGYDF